MLSHMPLLLLLLVSVMVINRMVPSIIPRVLKRGSKIITQGLPYDKVH